jgi:hypothetical protein
MCSQGRSQAEEGTSRRVTSEWHQGQVESVWGVAGAGLSGGPCRPSELASGRWPLRNMAKTTASAGAAYRYHCRQSGKGLCVLQDKGPPRSKMCWHFLGNAVMGSPGTQAGIRGRRTSARGPIRINEGCHVKCSGDINIVRVHGRVGVTNSGGGLKWCSRHLCDVGLHSLQSRVHPRKESLKVYPPWVAGW